MLLSSLFRPSRLALFAVGLTVTAGVVAGAGAQTTQAAAGANFNLPDPPIPYKTLPVPAGATLEDLPVGSGGAVAPIYYSSDPTNRADAKHAFVILHGRLRNGYDYFTTMKTIKDQAVQANIGGASTSDLIAAPQFFATEDGVLPHKNQLVWADLNQWQVGDDAVLPKNAGSVSSFDVLDTLLTTFADQSKFPKLTNVTFIGHGGGAQTMQRYSVVGMNSPDPARVHVRYVIADPSTSVYWSNDRPVQFDESQCSNYSSWRYGFDPYTIRYQLSDTLASLFVRWTTRDIINVIGLDDTAAEGDQGCEAFAQGGTERKNRNLAWWRYSNLLAGTQEDVSGFPGDFSNLSNWASLSGGKLNHRLATITGATHDAAAVLGSDVGRTALYGVVVQQGWRPPSNSTNAAQLKTEPSASISIPFAVSSAASTPAWMKSSGGQVTKGTPTPGSPQKSASNSARGRLAVGFGPGSWLRFEL